MRLTRKAALAGLASLAVAGAAWAAGTPEKPGAKVMEVALPGGGVARISYRGDVAPRVIVGPAPAAGYEAAPFAAMDRIMAEMDARAALMMREMQQLRM